MSGELPENETLDVWFSGRFQQVVPRGEIGSAKAFLEAEIRSSLGAEGEVSEISLSDSNNEKTMAEALKEIAEMRLTCSCQGQMKAQNIARAALKKVGT